MAVKFVPRIGTVNQSTPEEIDIADTILSRTDTKPFYVDEDGNTVDMD